MTGNSAERRTLGSSASNTGRRRDGRSRCGLKRERKALPMASASGRFAKLSAEGSVGTNCAGAGTESHRNMLSALRFSNLPPR